MKIYDVIIIGAGASGLMCATHLDKSLDIALVDANEKIAKKLKISGGGKCNITNKYVNSDNFDGDKEFISNILNIYSKDDLLRFLKTNSIELELRKNRYFFCKKSSDDIINILKKNSSHAKVLLNYKVEGLKKESGTFFLQTSKGVLKAKNIIVASGGKSFKTLGASEIGLDIAKSFNIKVKEFLPALVGLTTQPKESWMKSLSGLSCYVHIKIGDKTLKEEMLFTHKGISGPAVLSSSLYWKKGIISIDFLPDKNILDLIKKSKKQVISVIPLPKRLAKAILKAIDVDDAKCSSLDAKSKERLVNIHHYEFAPAGNFGFTKAEASSGGIIASELDHNSCESKDIDSLYFIGEVVDVTGELGGYNFQWAFSSAVACAKSLNKRLV